MLDGTELDTATFTSKWNESLQKWNKYPVGNIISEIYDLSLGYASAW
jgi:hypothetical protein